MIYYDVKHTGPGLCLHWQVCNKWIHLEQLLLHAISTSYLAGDPFQWTPPPYSPAKSSGLARPQRGCHRCCHSSLRLPGTTWSVPGKYFQKWRSHPSQWKSARPQCFKRGQTRWVGGCWKEPSVSIELQVDLWQLSAISNQKGVQDYSWRISRAACKLVAEFLLQGMQ